MKKIFAVMCVAAIAQFAVAGTKSVQFNAMIPNKKVVSEYIKNIPGVKGVKIDQKRGEVTVKYDDSKPSIGSISSAMSAAGIHASSLGENCALKPGGCLNNTPTVTNTMR